MKIIKNDFPFLTSHNITYLDNATTTHKPQSVIDAISNFYSTQYAPVHRSIYQSSERATTAFEQVRSTIAQFLGAHPNEIIFTQGTTHGINFIATAWALNTLKPGDEIVLTELEHHANLLPWQIVAHKTGAVLRYIPITSTGTLQLDSLSRIITKKTKLVSVVHVSHTLGSHTDITTIHAHARAVNAKILIDAAQAVAHQPIDLKLLDVDFLVFSGHKMLGPTGIGVLYITKKLHEHVPPYQYGGGMVFHADYHHATWQIAPQRYEAGTPPSAQVIGLGAAIQYIENNINFELLQAHEAALCKQTIEGLQKCDKVRILGPVEELAQSGHLVSFTVNGYHPHDVGAYLDTHGIAVRTGNFCAQPLEKKLGINGAIRVSFYGYTTSHEVDTLLDCIQKL